MLMVHRRWKKRHPDPKSGRGQSLRHARFCKSPAGNARSAACNAESPSGRRQRDRWRVRRAACRLSDQARTGGLGLNVPSGWMKAVWWNPQGQSMRGLLKVDWLFLMTAAAFRQLVANSEVETRPRLQVAQPPGYEFRAWRPTNTRSKSTQCGHKPSQIPLRSVSSSAL